MKTFKIKILSGLFVTTILASAGLAAAETVVEKQGSVTVDVSASQMSRIYVRGDKILSFRQMDDPNGPGLLTQTDENTGDLYVGFDGDATGRSYSMFLTTASGEVVQVILKPTSIDPKSIEIVPELHMTTPQQSKSAVRANGYSEIVVAFEKLMFNGDTADGVSYTPVDDKGTPTQNFNVKTEGYYKTDGLRGIVLYMVNRSTVPQEITAERFLVKHVIAAGVTNELVQPGSATRVFIVEEDQ